MIYSLYYYNKNSHFLRLRPCFNAPNSLEVHKGLYSRKRGSRKISYSTESKFRTNQMMRHVFPFHQITVDKFKDKLDWRQGGM
jgi:hypothetical protein